MDQYIWLDWLTRKIMQRKGITRSFCELLKDSMYQTSFPDVTKPRKTMTEIRTFSRKIVKNVQINLKTCLHDNIREFCDHIVAPIIIK